MQEFKRISTQDPHSEKSEAWFDNFGLLPTSNQDL